MYKRYTLLATALTFALPGVATAGRFSWFDETPARDSLGQIRTPTPLLSRDTRLTFGVDAYKSLAPGRTDEDLNETHSGGDATTLQFYGEVSPRSGDTSVPITALHPAGRAGEPVILGSASNRLSGFGIKLRHRVDASNTFALSAGYSEIPWGSQMSATTQTPSSYNMDVLDTRAALSWTGTWAGTLQPGMTGSVFMGGESARDEMYQRLGRRYYGFSLGGELRVAQEHTPYFSYRLRRNFYNPDDQNYLISPYDDRSQVAAGWKWQVQPNWSLQAEARYGLNGANLDPYSPERSRIFFGTRFDFR